MDKGAGGPKLRTALDSVHQRFGSGTLHYASSGIERAGKTQFHKRSPAYTTDWMQLPLMGFREMPKLTDRRLIRHRLTAQIKPDKLR